MNNLDGQILFALLVALVLAWTSSLLAARRYTEKVLEFMQRGSTPTDQSTEIYLGGTANSGGVPQSAEAIALARQNHYAVWRLRLIIILISVFSAVAIAYVAQTVYTEDSFSLRRLCLLTLVYAWPLVPSIGLLERWSRWKIMSVSIGFMSMAGLLVMFNSTENQNLSSMLLWLFGQQIPLLIFVFFMTGSKLRAVGPYLFVVFFLLTTSSLLGLSALEQLIGDDSDTWLMDLVSATNAYVVLILFGIVPWLMAFYPIRFMARFLAVAYRNKVFSEPLYLLAGIWSIVLIFQAMTLSHSAGLSAYYLLAVWLIIPFSAMRMKSVLCPQHQPPVMLLLRVFRGDDRVENLFDNVIEHWRYSGNTVMIAGKDLALRNLERDELFAFLSGHLQDRLISDDHRLQQAVQSWICKPTRMDVTGSMNFFVSIVLGN